MSSLTREVDNCKAHIMVYEALSEGFWTVLDTYSTASQQGISKYVSEPEKLATARAFLDVSFQKYCVDSDIEAHRSQTTSRNQTKHTDEESK